VRKNIRQTQTEGHITKYPTCDPQNVKVINNRKNLRNCNSKEEPAYMVHQCNMVSWMESYYLKRTNQENLNKVWPL
jgi:hypothetical protein